jgi:hypothetical protein
LYSAEELLVRADQAGDRLDARVRDVLGTLGWALVPKPERERPRRPRRGHDVPVKLESARPMTMVLVPAGSGPTAPPDAWLALQQIRATAGDLAGAFSLNHVVRACGSGGYWAGIGSGGYWAGIGSGGYWAGIGSGGYWAGISGPAEYAAPGYGGKAPVAVVLANPALSAPALKRPPVVVLPDTGIGPHAWFPRDDGIVKPPPGAVSVVAASTTLGIPDDHATFGSDLIGDPLPLAGHGTFIAGIIRQSCPAARLHAYAVMDSAGELFEDDLLDVLHGVLEQQLDALESGAATGIVDVVSLSAGFYHEDLDDDAAPATLAGSEVATVLRDLGRVGVLVVAGAGNDATRRPFLPAAFAGTLGTTGPDELPLVSVGALNPNRSTVALFSNAGDWVSTYRHGAAIVSTLPEVENAGAQSSTAAAPGAPDDHNRMTIDRDDFSSGFGVWSGTSFATPVLAGQLLQSLVDQGTEDARLDALLERGRKALALVVFEPERT